jgi:pimeloyl-ACP methyl ester carboxylesterase
MKLCQPVIYKLAYGIIACAIVSGCVAQAIDSQSPTLGRTINVPLDYKNPKLGRAPLYFEFGAPYEKSKPTIFIIADGQQFYVRRGTVTRLQQALFGDAFNVVGIVTRGSTQEFIKATLDGSGQPDWAKAWRIFNSEQWINDIESARRSVLGDKGKVLLYGRSGGAYLIHQYLAKYGAHVQRAFTQSAVHPLLNRELNIPLDTFWEELGAQDPGLQTALRQALNQHPGERIGILLALQRQHFYVTADKLPAARAEIIHTLAAGDMRKYEQAKKEYEVEGVMKLSESPEIIPQDVRVLELIYPSGAFQRIGGEGIYPLLETQHHFIKPLLTLLAEGKINLPTFDTRPAHSLAAEVFVLAGRWDEAVDYRTAIALAYLYPRHHLFIADDNHVFAKLTESGASSSIIQAFMKFGLDGPEFKNALDESKAHRWTQ